MFDRKELLQSKEYWLTRIQNNLFAMLERYMRENKLNRTKLAEHLGVSKGYVSQILNGDFDHRLSKFIELSLAIKKVPQIYFEDIDQVLDDDELGMLYDDDRNNRPVIKLNIDFGTSLQGEEDSQMESGSKELKKYYSTTLENFEASEPEIELS